MPEPPTGWNAHEAKKLEAPMSQSLPENNAVTTSDLRVAVLMVNWNGWQDTLTAYESLHQSTHLNWELIVVDNASEDESLTMLRGEKPRFCLVESPENLGFAGGCNLAIATARQRGADYIYLLNNDATVTAETLEVLLRTSKSLNDMGILGSVVRYPDGSIQFWGSRESADGGPFLTPPSEERLAEAPELIEADFILGASLLIPMSALDRVGDFDSRFFLNFEETDWCYRARRADYRCFVVKSALVVHKGGATIGHPDGPLQVYFMRRNRLLFCERNVPAARFAVIYLRQTIGAAFRLLRALLPNTKPADRMVAQARAIGTLDYSLRRFGDCPPMIRKMAAEYRNLPQEL